MPLETILPPTRVVPPHAVWIEVRLDRLLRNLERLREKVRPYTRVMAVVKSNAYGHGLVAVAKALQGKVDFLGLGSLKEASILREQGLHAPLFLFGRLFPEEIPLALQMNLTLTVSSFEEAKAISGVRPHGSKKVSLHIKVDTGMGRFGIPFPQALLEIEKIAALPGLRLEGLYTHFPAAERYPDPEGVRALRDFEGLIQNLRRKGISFPLRHVVNSAGALRIRSPRLNLVRPGLALYGIYPAPALEKEIELEPVLALKTRILFLKRLSPGDSVGYARQFIAARPTTVAVVPTGYAHGYPFHLSRKGEVLYRGRRFPIAGRIGMDSMMIDLKDLTEARVGEEVTLLGSEGNEKIRAEELALRAETIPYEVVTRLDPGIPRFYLSDETSDTPSDPLAL